MHARQRHACTLQVNPWLCMCVQATFVMDLHAHLSDFEVIGLLGGTWDAAAKRMQVPPLW